MLVKLQVGILKFKVPAKYLLFPLLFISLGISLITILPYIASEVKASQATFTWSYPGNGTNYTSFHTPQINFTLNVYNISGCTFNMGFPNMSWVVNSSAENFNITLSNDSAGGYWNSSPLNITSAGNQLDSNYARLYNITIFCNETGGDGSTGGNRTKAYRTFGVNTIEPTVRLVESSGYPIHANFTHVNTSTDEWLNFTFEVTDNDTSDGICGMNVTLENGTKLDITGSWQPTPMARARNCTLLFYGNQTVDGKVDFAFYARDESRTNQSDQNISAVSTYLPANKWTYITYTDENQTVYDLIDNMAFATSVSTFDNTNANKTYTTFTISSPTVGNTTMLYPGNNSVLYVTQNSWYIRPNYLPTQSLVEQDIKYRSEGFNRYINLTLSAGVTGCNGTYIVNSTTGNAADTLSQGDCAKAGTNKTSWNVFPIWSSMTLNDTLYLCDFVSNNSLAFVKSRVNSTVCFNSTSSASAYSFNQNRSILSGVGMDGGETTNQGPCYFDYVSYYNATSGKYMTCRYGWNLCTGCEREYAENCTATNITVRTGSAIFVRLTDWLFPANQTVASNFPVNQSSLMNMTVNMSALVSAWNHTRLV